MNIPWEKLIVALDVEQEHDMRRIIDALAPYHVKFKIGPIAFIRFGPALVRTLVREGNDIFIDLKLHDIPHTMQESAVALAQLGCWAFTVHTKAGLTALQAVRAKTMPQPGTTQRMPLVLGVTELTSARADVSQVLALAGIADASGIDAVVASPQEAGALKKAFPRLLVVTPGIRGPHDEKGDQKRTMRASEAFAAGSDYIVVGRPIISKKDYVRAAHDVLRA